MSCTKKSVCVLCVSVRERSRARENDQSLGGESLGEIQVTTRDASIKVNGTGAENKKVVCCRACQCGCIVGESIVLGGQMVRNRGRVNVILRDICDVFESVKECVLSVDKSELWNIDLLLCGVCVL